MSIFVRSSATVITAFLLAVPLALVGGLPANAAAPTVGLGVAGGYAVVGGSAVTNTGPSLISGNLGVASGTAISGFDVPGGPGLVVNGSIYKPSASNGARAAVDTAYLDAAGRTGTTIQSVELGGKNLVAGVYTAGDSETFGLTGTLTLTGDVDDVWIFQTNKTLITAFQSSIVLAGGAQACNVFWKVGSSATLGASSKFAGTILAAASISLGNDVTVRGRLLAGTGAVTLINDVVTMPSCATDTAAAAAAAQAAAAAAAAAAAQAAADHAAAQAAADAAAAVAAQAAADLVTAQAAADAAAAALAAAVPESPEAIAAAAALAAAAQTLALAEEAAADAAQAAADAADAETAAGILSSVAVRYTRILMEDSINAAALLSAAVLPKTGVSIAPVIGAGLTLLVVGGLLVARTRRATAVTSRAHRAN